VEEIHDRVAATVGRRAAEKWMREFYAKLRTLRTMPFMYEVVPEAEEPGAALRHFAHRNHRVIYRVEERVLVVVRIIRATRLLTPEMLQEAPP
jgi:plasmid stabilization system protein ParE